MPYGTRHLDWDGVPGVPSAGADSTQGLLSTFPYGKGAFGESCFGLAAHRDGKLEGLNGSG